MLGGGTFVTQNKILPGAYINFVSLARASAALSERGIATIPIIGDWGMLGEVFEVTTADIQRHSLALFGYDYSDSMLKPLREFFSNIRIGYLYRLGTGGAKAKIEVDSTTIVEAKYPGIAGNNITIACSENVDDPLLFDVKTFYNGIEVDSQTAPDWNGLQDNAYIHIVDTSIAIQPTAGVTLTGGTNPVVTNADYQSYLDSIESYTFNAIGCPSDDTAVKALFTAFTKRLRDEQGIKFQCVTYDNQADYEGVVNLANSVTDVGADLYSLIYWVTGVIAGTEVNKSATNRIYNGEYSVYVKYTQTELERAIKSGKFIFHRVGDDIRVLTDINSLTTLTLEKGEVFKKNQTIRVIDQIANDIAVIFNTRYLGIVPNDHGGRVSLWADIVKHHEQLQQIRAIEDFKGENVVVEQGDTKESVLVSDLITVVNTMEKLYMNVILA